MTPNEPQPLDLANLGAMFRDDEKEFINALPETERVSASTYLAAGDAAERDQRRMYLANARFLEKKFNKTSDEVVDQYDALKNAYVAQVLKEDAIDLDDVAFYGRVKGEFDKWNKKTTGYGELVDGLTQDFVNEKAQDFDRTFSARLAEVEKKAGAFDPETRALFRATASQQWAEYAKRQDELGPAIAATMQYFASKKPESATSDTATHAKALISPQSIPEAQTSAIRALLSLSKNDQDFVIQRAAAMAAMPSEDGWLTKLNKRVGRAHMDFDRFGGQVIDQAGAAVARAFGDKDTANQSKAMQQQFEIERRLSNALQGKVDPAEGNNWASESLLAAASSLERMLLSMTPAGMALNAAVYKPEIQGQLIDRGVPEDKAAWLSLIGAPVMAGIDRLESKFAFHGWIPGGGTILNNFASRFAKTGATFVLQGGQQLLQEQGQAMVAPVLQEIGSVMDETIPGVDLWKEAKDVLKDTPATFGALLPYVIIGTARGRMKDRKVEKLMLQQRDNLLALGYDNAVINAIAKSRDGDVAAEIMQTNWDKRTPDSKKAQEARARIEAKGRSIDLSDSGASLLSPDELAAGITSQSAGYNPEIAVRFRHDEEGGLSVLDSEGQVIGTASDAQEAAMIALRYQKNTAALTEAQDYADAKMELPEGTVFTVFEPGPGSPVGSVQADFYETDPDTGQVVNTRSFMLEELQNEGYAVPAVPVDIAKGKYSVAQMKEEATARGGKVAMTTTSSFERPANTPTVRRDKEGGFIALDADGKEIGRAATPEEMASLLRDQPDDETIKLTQAEIKKLRAAVPGLEELPETERQSFQQWLAKAQQPETEGGSSLVLKAEQIAGEIANKPRVLSHIEHAAVLLRTAQVHNDYTASVRAAIEAFNQGDVQRAQDLWRASTKIAATYDLLTMAAKFAGSEAGRALAARRMTISLNTYELVHVKGLIESASGKPMTQEQAAELQKVLDERDALKAKIEAMEERERNRAEEQVGDRAEQFVEKAKRKRITKQAEGEAKERKPWKRKPKKELTREELIAKLEKVGFDLKKGGEITPGVAGLLAKIGETYVADGVANLHDLTGKMRSDIPALSENQIHQSFAGQITEEAATPTEMKKQVKELKKQAGLWADIHALLDSGDVETKDKVLGSEKVRQLQEILAKLRLNALKTVRDDATLARINERINTVQDRLLGKPADPTTEESAKQESAKIVEARELLAELEKQLKVQDSITELEDLLRTRTPPPEKRRRKAESDKLTELRIKKRELERAVTQMVEASMPITAKYVAGEIGEGFRTLKTMGDFGAIFRQAAFLAPRNFRAFLDANVDAARSFLSKHTADEVDLMIRSMPEQVWRDRAGLTLTAFDKNIGIREENFTGTGLQRIPGFRKSGLQWYKEAGERHMVTMVNLMRVAAFDQFHKANPFASLETLQTYARYVNIATGRGELGVFAPTAKLLSKVAFSPRFAMSRIQLLAAPIMFKNDPAVLKEVAKDWTAFVISGMTVLGLAAMVKGVRVGDDPETSDFGKIIIGDTRIDLWAGLQQTAMLTAKAMMVPADRAGIIELDKDINLMDAFLRYVSYRASPGVTVPYSIATGENVIGQEVELPEALVRGVAPMWMESVYDTLDNTGDPVYAAGIGAISFVGFGTSEQAPKKRKWKE